MNRIALQMLIGDRLKYFGLVAGVAFAAMLITQQASILVGLAHQTGAFIRDTSQADLWVMDPQVRFSQDTLPLQDTTLLRVRGIDGVAWAVPMFQSFARGQLPDGTRMLMILVGIDDASLVGGPPGMVEGTLSDLRRDRAVFIDAEAAKTKMVMKRGGGRGLRMGDRIAFNDREGIVSGTFTASKSFFWEPMVYTTYSRALQFTPPDRRVMAYVLVKVKDGTPASLVADRIHAATGLRAVTNEGFIDLTTRYILYETGILVNFGLAVGLGFLIGVLVVGQMMYNFTLDNLRHYGALKAMGTGNWALLRMVFVQVLTVGVLGYGIGIGVGTGLGKVVEANNLAFRMPWQIPVAGAAAILLICLVSGALSVWKVLTLEPAVVFKA